MPGEKVLVVLGVLGATDAPVDDAREMQPAAHLAQIDVARVAGFEGLLGVTRLVDIEQRRGGGERRHGATAKA
jgi:hypothetical protein